MKTHPASGSGIEGIARFARLLALLGILTLAVLGQSKASDPFPNKGLTRARSRSAAPVTCPLR